MHLTDIKDLLDARGIQLTKSLGQNFLHDENQLRRIVVAADLRPEDQVLEVGPGLGALTQPLLQTGARVLAIEKDRRIFDYLLHRWADEPRLTLVHADALEYLRARTRDWSTWKLVANLPYSVASPILVELASLAAGPERLVATVQFEVAERIAASAADDAYGLLSLLLQVRYEPKGMFQIPAACFFPRPSIDSACVTLIRRSKLLLQPSQFAAFTKIVKRGFSQRRKMMMKLLKADWPLASVTAALEQLGISLQARAESLSLEQFVELTKLLAPPKDSV